MSSHLKLYNAEAENYICLSRLSQHPILLASRIILANPRLQLSELKRTNDYPFNFCLEWEIDLSFSQIQALYPYLYDHHRNSKMPGLKALLALYP